MKLLTLRNTTLQDMDWLYELTVTSYIEVVEQQFGEWVHEAEKQKVRLKWQLGSGKIILKGADRIGALLIEDWQEYDLLREILILPEFQNQGIGTHYIQHAIDQARSKNRPLRLRVLFENLRARTLYERLGFVQVQQLEHQYLLETR